MTVDELLKRLTKLKHREVIWGRVADFLHQFLSQDIGEPQQMTAEDCLIPNIPEEEIEAVLEESIYFLLEGIEKEVAELGAMQVGNGKPATKRKPAVRAARKKRS